ncbi:hypothetical protein [Paraburkholderia sp. EG304]|uniref:hypothetical protein n=1 Tax=Paraburkholderia sp. EG304 TaxID=3237015 RepID=UPI0039789D12
MYAYKALASAGAVDFIAGTMDKNENSLWDDGGDWVRKLQGSMRRRAIGRRAQGTKKNATKAIFVAFCHWCAAGAASAKRARI